MLYQQPQHGPTQIDWANPITRGLVIAVLPNSSFNLAGKDVLTPSSGYTRTVNTTGIATATEYLQWPEPANSSAIGAQYDLTTLTAFVYGRQTTPQNAAATFCRGQGSSTGNGWAVGFHGGSNNGAYATACGSTLQPSASFATLTNPTTALVTVDPTNGVNLYCNGKFQQSATYATPTYQYSPGTNRGVLFGSKDGPGNTFTNQLSLGLLWNRVLSVAEIASISTNPWQVFLDEDEEETLLFVQGGGGGPLTYSYTATGGFILSGTVPNIKSRLKSGAGGLTFAGTTPVIRGADRRASGGLTFGGSTRAVRERLVSALGGVLFSGAAGLSFFASVQSLVITASGGINVSGSAARVRGIVRTVTGGVVFGGSSAVTLTPDPNPTTQKHFKRGRRPRTKV